MALAQATAEYTVTFVSTWSAATHPDAFPTNAHFSPLVGMTHDASAGLWAPGGTASLGMEAMAERGQTAVLLSEAGLAIAAGGGGASFTGPAIGTSPGTASMSFTATEAFPLVTLVTMLAPSPDWFVGVHGLDLRPGGAWADRVVAELYVYDAGTDSGTTYTAPDLDTQPRAPIALSAVPPFLVGGSVPAVGRFTFERTGQTAGEGGPAGGFALSLPSPNPTRSVSAITLTLGRPQRVTVRVFDALGRTVATLAEGDHAAGPLSLRLDAARLPAGVYTVRAQGEEAVAVQRLVVATR